MQPDEDLKAGDRILFLLKVRGPMTAKALAEELDVTAIAVRQHLQGLEGKGLVTHNLMKGRVGRPAHVWKLTSAAEVRFPDNHRELTRGLLSAVRSVFGEEGLQRVVRTWAERESKRARRANASSTATRSSEWFQTGRTVSSSGTRTPPPPRFWVAHRRAYLSTT